MADLIRLAQALACIESAACSLRLAARRQPAGPGLDYTAWFGRAEASLCFGNALIEVLRVRRCRILGSGRFALPRQ